MQPSRLFGISHIDSFAAATVTHVKVHAVSCSTLQCKSLGYVASVKTTCDCVVKLLAIPLANYRSFPWHLSRSNVHCTKSWLKCTEEITHSPKKGKRRRKRSPVAILQVCSIQYIQNVFKLYRSTKGIMRDSLEMKRKCKKAKATEQTKGSKAAAVFAF